MKKKICSLILALLVCLAMGTQVLASAMEPVCVEPEHRSCVIGKGSEAVLDSDSVSPLPNSSLDHLFSISTDGGTGFTHLLASSGNKKFKHEDLTNGGLLIMGTLSSNDPVTDTYLRAGYATYNSSRDEYEAIDYALFKNGEYSSAYFGLNFWYSYTYYGFAGKDTVSNSIAKGALNFYNASR